MVVAKEVRIGGREVVADEGCGQGSSDVWQRQSGDMDGEGVIGCRRKEEEEEEKTKGRRKKRKKRERGGVLYYVAHQRG